MTSLATATTTMAVGLVATLEDAAKKKDVGLTPPQHIETISTWLSQADNIKNQKESAPVTLEKANKSILPQDATPPTDLVKTIDLARSLPSETEVTKNYRFMISNKREEVLEFLKQVPNMDGAQTEAQLLAWVTVNYAHTGKISSLWEFNLKYSTPEVQRIFLCEQVFWHAWYHAEALLDSRFDHLANCLKPMVYNDIQSSASGNLIDSIVRQIDAHNHKFWDGSKSSPQHAVFLDNASILGKFYDEVFQFCKLLFLIGWKLSWSQNQGMEYTYDTQDLGPQMLWICAYPQLKSQDQKVKVEGCIYHRKSAPLVAPPPTPFLQPLPSSIL